MAANIIVGTVLAVLILLAVRKVVKDRKKGVGSCGMNCSSCPALRKVSMRTETAMTAADAARVRFLARREKTANRTRILEERTAAS